MEGILVHAKRPNGRDRRDRLQRRSSAKFEPVRAKLNVRSQGTIETSAGSWPDVVFDTEPVSNRPMNNRTRFNTYR